jgi:hypothetical protein
MKPNTLIWYQFESVGQPRHTLKGQDTVRETLATLARWTLSVYMGAKIRVTFARDEIDLAPDRRTAGKHHDIMNDLESILNENAEESDGHSS